MLDFALILAVGILCNFYIPRPFTLKLDSAYLILIVCGTNPLNDVNIIGATLKFFAYLVNACFFDALKRSTTAYVLDFYVKVNLSIKKLTLN